MMGKSMGKSARFVMVRGRLDNPEGAGKGALIGGGLGALGGALYGAIWPGHLNFETSGSDAFETEGPKKNRRYYINDEGKKHYYYVDDDGNILMKRRGRLSGAAVHGLAGGLLGTFGGGVIGNFSPK
jgi:hypothetical protein